MRTCHRRPLEQRLRLPKRQPCAMRHVPRGDMLGKWKIRLWGQGRGQQNKAKQCTTMMATDSHTTRRKHQRQPNTQRPVWGADPPHGHCTHAQPPPPTNGARAQESQAGPGGSDSAPPMGGRPCPSASEVTRTRPPREERPCPGSRGRRASWRQHST